MVWPATIAKACMPRSRCMLSTQVISPNRSKLGYLTRLNLCSCSILALLMMKQIKTQLFSKNHAPSQTTVKSLQTTTPSPTRFNAWFPNIHIYIYMQMNSERMHTILCIRRTFIWFKPMGYPISIACCVTVYMKCYLRLVGVEGVGGGDCIRISLKSEISIMKLCET